MSKSVLKQYMHETRDTLTDLEKSMQIDDEQHVRVLLNRLWKLLETIEARYD